mgnify:CR=1 FL=1
MGTSCSQEVGNDDELMANEAPPRSIIPSSIKEQVVLHGPMTIARAKKLRESFQTLARDVQAQVGDMKTIQGLGHEDTMLYTLIELIDSSDEG